ncbi:MAG: dTDP-4-dehydrorhamnose reductase [Bacteroidetes bacterium HGW-Bacteroidetes-15]|nr:MAG: dTDP-4-dehydrorhamnose reductase [Bacteroidetes bacterium HGW-Bacteroidetes-15]
MKNILVTGSNGQLGSEIRERSKELSQFNFIFVDVEDMDIANNKEVEAFFSKTNIDGIINTAAYTAVDKAENEEKLAFAINETGVKYLCQISEKYNIFLIHISTDYVFDGEKDIAYTPNDEVNPNSVYGKSKLAGEMQIVNSNINYAIVRTSWLYSSKGNNFVKTILKHAKVKSSLNVVDDQFGSPTYAGDLADATLKILKIISNKIIRKTYHYSNEGKTSWFDFAREIVNIANIKCNINPIKTEEYPTLAKRPKYSVMDKSAIKNDFQIKIPHWKESLKKCYNLIMR